MDTFSPPAADHVDYVDATICGKSMRLRIDRQDLPTFEKTMGETSSYVLITTIRLGNWKLAHVRDTIRFAAMPADLLRRFRTLGFGTQFKTFAGRPAVPFLDQVFATQPPGRYVPLAMLLLTAALFGLPSDQAVWSDVEVAEEG